MKKYICVNFLQCDYADEKPPREFELAGVLNNVCPECGSANIREVTPINKFPIKYIILGLGTVLLICLLYIGLKDGDSTKTEESLVGSGNVNKPEVKDSVENSIRVTKEKQKADKHDNPVFWTRVPGSEFCVSNCVQTYNEVDNLGHTRERKIENCADCRMDDK